MRTKSKTKTIKYKLNMTDKNESLEFEARNFIEAFEIAMKLGLDSTSMHICEVFS